MNKGFESLKKEFQKGNLEKVKELLKTLKLELVSSQKFLVGGTESELLVAREILEIGVYYSIKLGDISGFERYLAQLKGM
jgi:26S proteasome regulatory subunit N12